MERVRWGILSTAEIGVEKVIPAMQAASACEVVAIASRSRERAQAAAGALGLPEAYGSYEALLDAGDLDAVYIPLPNHLHVEWSIEALRAGKHVLCEKPVALDAAGAEKLRDTARRHPGLKVMEAFMYRFHPQWQRVHELIAEGRIGALRTVHGHFSFFNEDPGDIRNRAEMGGGALLDVGCYCLSAARWLFGAEPTGARRVVREDARFGVDALSSGVLAFEEGTATFTCSTQMSRCQHVAAIGTEGRLEVETPFSVPPDEACRLRLWRGGDCEELTVEPRNHYTAQAERFAEAVLSGTPFVSGITKSTHSNWSTMKPQKMPDARPTARPASTGRLPRTGKTPSPRS